MACNLFKIASHFPIYRHTICNMEVPDNRIVIFYVPVPTEQEAKYIAIKLLKNKHIACANIIPNVCAMYVWDGEAVEENKESVLILKTANRLQSTVEELIKKWHPYACPAIISYDVKVNTTFVRWVESVVY